MTYLELINSVLVRLREPTVSSVSADPYTRLIGELVNDAKNAVESAAPWTDQTQFRAIDTAIGDAKTTAEGITKGSLVYSVWDRTQKRALVRTPLVNLLELRQVETDQGRPTKWAVQGYDGDDLILRLHPVPDQSYQFYAVYTKTTGRLTSANNEIECPEEPVIFHAYAYAIKERGEDQGKSFLEALDSYKRSLSRAIIANASDKGGGEVWQVL